MSEMLERVAMALLESEWAIHKTDTAHIDPPIERRWRETAEVSKAHFRRKARIAVTAMTEPTTPMILEACRVAALEQCRPVSINRKDAYDCWKAMVSEILK